MNKKEIIGDIIRRIKVIFFELFGMVAVFYLLYFYNLQLLKSVAPVFSLPFIFVIKEIFNIIKDILYLIGIGYKIDSSADKINKSNFASKINKIFSIHPVLSILIITILIILAAVIPSFFVAILYK